DARIAPIYEGTNGIQAADLVGRKLALEGGAAFEALIADIRAEAGDAQALSDLADACAAVVANFTTMDIDQRLTASYPFLTMLSVAVAGWLMQRQRKAAVGDSHFEEMKRAAADYYLDQVVPEATGLLAAAISPACVHDVSDAAFAA
ncbi:MAG: acyl-CoA dehydrogenase, partial [Pseudomonadota bacterium]|nr:acyl-CoA dehydrogenase [Pseudomonadota bacterium]